MVLEKKEHIESFQDQKKSFHNEYKYVKVATNESENSEKVGADGRLEKALKYISQTGNVAPGTNMEKSVESPVDNLIKKYKTTIEKVASDFGVDKYLIAGIIYEEQKLIGPEDSLDIRAASFGADTSIGLGQVKVSTAQKLHMREYVKPKDIERKIIISRLKIDEWNIEYVAAYLNYLQDIRKGEFPSIKERPDILATLYNIGKEEAHSNPQPNKYGRAVKNIYGHMKQLMG